MVSKKPKPSGKVYYFNFTKTGNKVIEDRHWKDDARFNLSKYLDAWELIK